MVCGVVLRGGVCPREAGGWRSEIDLNDVEDIEDVADAAAQVESDDGLVVVLLEEEDWFGVVRVETDEDPRVYVSDAAEAGRTIMGEAALSELAGEYAVGDDRGPTSALPAEPLGDVGLLDDLGVSAGDAGPVGRGHGHHALRRVADARRAARIRRSARDGPLNGAGSGPAKRWRALGRRDARSARRGGAGRAGR